MLIFLWFQSLLMKKKRIKILLYLFYRLRFMHQIRKDIKSDKYSLSITHYYRKVDTLLPFNFINVTILRVT